MDKNYSNDNYNLVYSDTMIITNYILRNSVAILIYLPSDIPLAPKTTMCVVHPRRICSVMPGMSCTSSLVVLEDFVDVNDNGILIQPIVAVT